MIFHSKQASSPCYSLCFKTVNTLVLEWQGCPICIVMANLPTWQCRQYLRLTVRVPILLWVLFRGQLMSRGTVLKALSYAQGQGMWWPIDWIREEHYASSCWIQDSCGSNPPSICPLFFGQITNEAWTEVHFWHDHMEVSWSTIWSTILFSTYIILCGVSCCYKECIGDLLTLEAPGRYILLMCVMS